MKKIKVGFLLAILMSMVEAQASLGYDAYIDGIYYKFHEMEATVTSKIVPGFGGSNKDAYSGHVVIPNSVTRYGFTYTVTGIDDYAFNNCSSLYSITIPESITTIGDKAFYGCTSLSSIVIPQEVTSIGEWAFHDCTALSYICFPDNLTKVGEDAFWNTRWYDNQLDGMIYIGLVAYSYKGKIPENTDLVLKDGIKTIANNAFYYKNNNGIVGGAYSTGKQDGLRSIVIPNSVTTIGNNAFVNCCGLSEIFIPNSVTEIGLSPFYGCSNLSSINVDSGNLYYDSRNNCNAIIETATNTLIAGCMSTGIPNSVTSIGRSAFQGCGFSTVIIPSSVTTIGDDAFLGCSKLTSITIPSSVTSIGISAFRNCTGLETISIPNSVTDIGNYAFSECNNLKTIIIPSSVNSIGYSAFANTAWYDAQPDGIVYAGKVAYKYKGTMPAHTDVVFKEGTLGIAGNAFYNCSDLASITIPSTVTNIGAYTFSGCTGLNSLIIPSSVKIIGSYAFSNCSNLTSTYLSDGLMNIGDHAFVNCYSLTSVTIPSSVMTIGIYSFCDCSALTSVTVGMKTPCTLDEQRTFSNRWNATLYVPYGCKAAYQNADYWKEFKEIVELEDESNNNTLFATELEALISTKVVLPIELTNEDEVKLCQFDLQLPAGVTVATKSNGKLDAKLTERAENHSISSQRLSNGNYRFVVSSLDNESFTGNSGTLMEITLDVSATMEAGEYTVKVLNAELSVPDGNDLMVARPADTESKLTVKAYTPGDVNNDGSVSVTDVGCAINYILEQVPSVFVFEAADMNGDKTVSVTDVGMIINLILNEGAASRRSGRYAATDARLSLEPVANGYELKLEDKDEFIGFQFDVELGEGMSIEDVRLNGHGESDHVLTYRRLQSLEASPTTRWRVVCYSPTNSVFAASDDALLTFTVVGEASKLYTGTVVGEASKLYGNPVAITNIRLTTAGLEELRPAALVGTPTGIASLERGMKMSTEGQTLRITSDRDTVLRIYTLDGRAYRTLQLRKGANSLDGLRAGVYMVNNKKIIIR